MKYTRVGFLMRKVMVSIIALIAAFTLLALGLNDNQQNLFVKFFTDMATA